MRRPTSSPTASAARSPAPPGSSAPSLGRRERAGTSKATIDHARPDANPPTPDLRRILVPVGVVAVYSASNFPFAFSVAGGDTASALAAGCPVVIKAHPGHPRLSVATAELMRETLAQAGAPDGLVGLVHGFDAGLALVEHPLVRAAAFTGSLRGGRALFDAASGRPDPIPFYGELGSVNPVFVTAGADRTRAADLAEGLAGSFRMSRGQLCTKPGVVFVPRGARLITELTTRIDGNGLGDLVTPAITTGFAEAMRRRANDARVRLIAGAAQQPEVGAAATVHLTDVEAVNADPSLLDEVFGPTTLLVEYDDLDDALSAAERLGGSLTATVHAQDGDLTPELVARLSDLAGRVLFEGWPTGVAVSAAQTHGGPWPATNSLHSSVGTSAARRFLRPVTYQSAPEAVLPLELRDGNPLDVPQLVDQFRQDRAATAGRRLDPKPRSS